MAKDKKPQNIRIIKNAEKPETPELLAESIINISKSFKKLSDQGLTQNAIIILLKGMPGMKDASVVDIRLTLENLPKLSSYYVRN